MILVSGGTGFIGQALIRHLSEVDLPIRTLIRPSVSNPNLPFGIPVEVAVTSLSDLRGLRAAMIGVDTIFHLVSGEWRGPRASLMEIDISGTQNILQAAGDAGVKRIFYLSHLGADRASAYPVLKAKAIAEEYIRRCGIDYTIVRTALVFGPGDGFTTGLARLLHGFPGVFFLPGEGNMLLQPLWVEDLVTCLTWALIDDTNRNTMIELGGPEYLSFRHIVELVMGESGTRRKLIHLPAAYLRWFTVTIETFFPGMPVSQYWLDYLAVNRTCALDSVPRAFNLLPSRFAHRLAYLNNKEWGKNFWRNLWKRNP